MFRLNRFYLFYAFTYSLWIVFDFIIFPILPISMFEAGTTELFQQNVIFPITYGVGLFLLIFSILRFSRVMRLLYSALFAITVPFAFVSLFELIWSNAYLITGGWKLLDYWYAALCVWFVFGLTSIRFWKVTTKFWIVFFLFIASWIVWIVFGYPQITGYNTDGSALLYDFSVAMNSVTKVLSGAIFAILIYDGTRKATREKFS